MIVYYINAIDMIESIWIRKLFISWLVFVG
nr:MAG TPA: hypothetical protein [Caudoviricetes sp.]